MSLDNRRLMVSSSTFGEGKTTVTLGLAMALIDLGFRVLIVDGDFRRAERIDQFHMRSVWFRQLSRGDAFSEVMRMDVGLETSM